MTHRIYYKGTDFRLIPTSGSEAAPEPEPEPPPLEGIEVSCLVIRYEAGTGPCLVSCGFLVPPGVITDTTLANRKIAVAVNGVEVAANVTGLRGRHRDESYKSVLIQFTYTMAQGDELPAVVFLNGSARGYTDPAYVRPTLAIVQAGNVIIPTSAAYLCSCKMWRNLLPAGSATVAEEKYFTALASAQLDWVMREYPTVVSISFYEDYHTMAQLWMRTATKRFHRFMWQWGLDCLNFSTPNPRPHPEGCPLIAAVANPDGRYHVRMDCRAPVNEAQTARSFSLATMYLMTGYRDFWGITAFYAAWGMQYWHYTDPSDSYQYMIMDAIAHPRPNYINYGHLLPVTMIDATIPVPIYGAYVENWEQRIGQVLQAFEDHRWNFHWIPFNTGAGVYPARAYKAWSDPEVIPNTVNQGGVSAGFLYIAAQKNAPCIISGGTMPTSGYIACMPPTGGSFSAGALTIGSTATAVATAANEPDIANGFVGTRFVRGNTDVSSPYFQWVFPCNFLIDIYLYLKRDDRIPGWIKSIVDVILEAQRIKAPIDYHYSVNNLTWGAPEWMCGYLILNPPIISPTQVDLRSYVLSFFTRAIAFVYKTIGDQTVNGAPYSTWYQRAINTGQICPPGPGGGCLDWAMKHFGEYFSCTQDAPWIMAQNNLSALAPTTMRTPTQWDTIPGDIPDVAVAPEPEEP